MNPSWAQNPPFASRILPFSVLLRLECWCARMIGSGLGLFTHTNMLASFMFDVYNPLTLSYAGTLFTLSSPIRAKSRLKRLRLIF